MIGFAFGIGSLAACALVLSAVAFRWIEKEKGYKEAERRAINDAEKQHKFDFSQELAAAGRGR
jgi:hypothetical protein